jgi:hypothetical protein
MRSARDSFQLFSTPHTSERQCQKKLFGTRGARLHPGKKTKQGIPAETNVQPTHERQLLVNDDKLLVVAPQDALEVQYRVPHLPRTQ